MADRDRGAPGGAGGYFGSGWFTTPRLAWTRPRVMEEYREEYEPSPGQWPAGPYAGRGPRGYRRPDDRIRDDVCARLTAHGGVDATDVEVAVEDGEVTLTGTVEDRAQKRLAGDVAESVPGVRDVHNRLRLRRTGGPTDQGPR